MATVEITDDYYAILKVHQKASEIEIKKSYRSLAMVHHPDKNRNTPEATASFQLLNTAYQTLKDPTSRRIYDMRWPHITKTHQMAEEKAKRDEDATKTEREKSSRENAARENEERKSKLAIDNLRKRRQILESDVFEAGRSVVRLTAQLKTIQAADEKAAAEENARNSWWTKLWGAAPDPDDEKQERELQRFQRIASKTIKETDLSREESKLKEWTDLLSGLEKALAKEEAKAERVRQVYRQQEEAKRSQKVYEENMASLKKQRQEEAERESKRRAEAQARAQQEREARLAAEERRRREEEIKQKQAEEEAEKQRKRNEEIMRRRRKLEQQRQKEKREAEELRNKEQRRREAKARTKLNETDDDILYFMYDDLGRSPPSRSTARSRATTAASASGSASTSAKSPPTPPGCTHKGWWTKVEDGSLVCDNCSTRHWKFILECPACQMRACAECRPALQGRARGRPR